MSGPLDKRRTSGSGAAVDLIASIGASVSGLTVTGAAGPKTFTRSGGSWLTDGFAVGDKVWFFGFTAGAAGMNGSNFTITTLTALVMTVSEAVTAVTDAPSIECHVAERDGAAGIVLSSVMVSYSAAPAAAVAIQVRDTGGVIWQGYWGGAGGAKAFRSGLALAKGRSVRVACAAGGGSVVTDVALNGRLL